jgi:hypothetical protein
LSRIFTKDDERIQKPEKVMLVKKYRLLFIIGMGFMVAGFLPVVTIYEPTLYLFATRTNTYAIPGAGLIIIAITGLISLVFARNKFHSNWSVLASIFPLVLIGIFVQVNVQHESKLAWDEQKQIFNEFISIAPDIKDNSVVYFILPGYKKMRSAERTPLTAMWEVTGALEVLYGKGSLAGDVIFPDLSVPDYLSFQENGILDKTNGNLTPYSRAVFVAYEGRPRRLSLVENLQKELNLKWTPQGYAPNSRILNEQHVVELRRLIAR